MSDGGYVYVIEFGNGLIKVGHTQKIATRLRTHKQTARSFGLTVNRSWESPYHDSYKANESTLKRLASELGGTPTTAEYYNGLSFDALVEKARELPFSQTTSERAIRLATLQKHAKREEVKAGIAFQCIDLGMRPEHIREIRPDLADYIELMLRTEDNLREEIGAPPARRPVIKTKLDNP